VTPGPWSGGFSGVPADVRAKLCWIMAGAVGLLALFWAENAPADWINLTGAETAPTIAEITVTDDGVHVVLEIFPADLEVFEDILPDRLFRAPAPKRPAPEFRYARFARNVLRISTAAGQVLPVRVGVVELRRRTDRKSPYAGMVNPQTGRPVRAAPADKRVIYAELDYAFEGRPDHLVITPPLGADDRAKLSIGFVVYHQSVPVIDFRFLSRAARLNLDWQDPWYSKFDNPNLRRHHRDALMTFLYVEPRQIRQEALMRVRDLAQWTDLGLNSRQRIDVADQESLRRRAEKFFAGKNPLWVDGRIVTPVVVRARFIEIGLGGINVVEDPKPLDSNSALIGLIASYDSDHLPKKITVDWQLFNERQPRVPATLTDPAGPLMTFVTREESTITWENFLKQYQEPKPELVAAASRYAVSIPLLSIVLVVLALAAAVLGLRNAKNRRVAWGVGAVAAIIGATLTLSVARLDFANPLASKPTAVEGAAIVGRLLANLQIALFEHADEQRAAAFAVSVATERRSQVEAETRRALEIRLQGGGTARSYKIDEVELRQISDLDRPGAVGAIASWKTVASGGHWGHLHRRVISYEARVEIAPIDGAWKFTGLTVTDAR
jgi:hypothetical protein